jgi:toxin YoeB
MNLVFSDTALLDLAYWNKNEPGKTEKISALLADIMHTPFSGLGKPEPLQHALRGYWSRRINHEHRLVYKVEKDTVYVASCRFHYTA